MAMKQTRPMIIAILTIVFSQNAYAATDVVKVSKELPANIAKEISQIPEKPHFLLGLEPKDDVWEQSLEQIKVFQTKDLIYGKNGSGLIDKSNPDYRASANTMIIEKLSVANKKIIVLYTHHHFTADEMYTFWGRTGETNLAQYSTLYRKYAMRWEAGQLNDTQWQNIQRLLGWAQFEAVRNFVSSKIEGGLRKNLKDYSEMNLTSGVIDARAALLEDPNYGEHLDDPVPGTSLKVRDILPIPLTRPEDFLPDLLIIGPKGFYGGFANIKTPEMERIVFLDLLGLALSYVKKSDALVAHEFVHTNPYLQGLPFSLYYDIEMWADLTTFLDDDFTVYLLHPYQAVVRDSVKALWGYDFKEVIRRMIKPGLGVRDIREKEFRTHAAEVKKISEELTRFIKDPKDGFMVTFYRDLYYWLAINTKFCDKAAAWRILFALRYEPAGIFDPDKKDKDGNVISPVNQTKEWLNREEEAGRIKALAELAMRKTGEKTEFTDKMPKIFDNSDLMKCPVDSRFFLLTDKERRRFVEIVEHLTALARQGDIEARVLLSRIFNNTGFLPVISSKK